MILEICDELSLGENEDGDRRKCGMCRTRDAVGRISCYRRVLDLPLIGVALAPSPRIFLSLPCTITRIAQVWLHWNLLRNGVPRCNVHRLAGERGGCGGAGLVRRDPNVHLLLRTGVCSE